MGEKKGYTGRGKLICDFPTQAGLFIQKEDGRWTQTTPTIFRSWLGGRKYYIPAETTLGKVEVEMKEVEYKGPVYMFHTNLLSYSLEKTGIAGEMPECKRTRI